MSNVPQGPGWWLASDGKYYPPQQPTPAEPAKQGLSTRTVGIGMAVALLVSLVLIGIGSALTADDAPQLTPQQLQLADSIDDASDVRMTDAEMVAAADEVCARWAPGGPVDGAMDRLLDAVQDEFNDNGRHPDQAEAARIAGAINRMDYCA